MTRTLTIEIANNLDAGFSATWISIYQFFYKILAHTFTE